VVFLHSRSPQYLKNSKLHCTLLIPGPQPYQLLIILHLPKYNFNKIRLLSSAEKPAFSFFLHSFLPLSLSLSLSLPSVLFLLVLLLVFRLQMTNGMAFRCFNPLCKFFGVK